MRLTSFRRLLIALDRVYEETMTTNLYTSTRFVVRATVPPAVVVGQHEEFGNEYLHYFSYIMQNSTIHVIYLFLMYKIYIFRLLLCFWFLFALLRW